MGMATGTPLSRRHRRRLPVKGRHLEDHRVRRSSDGCAPWVKCHLLILHQQGQLCLVIALLLGMALKEAQPVLLAPPHLLARTLPVAPPEALARRPRPYQLHPALVLKTLLPRGQRPSLRLLGPLQAQIPDLTPERPTGHPVSLGQAIACQTPLLVLPKLMPRATVRI